MFGSNVELTPLLGVFGTSETFKTFRETGTLGAHAPKNVQLLQDFSGSAPLVVI